MLLATSLGMSATVKINEIMPCNISAYMDGSTYDFPSWIEFYNDGDAVDLKQNSADSEVENGMTEMQYVVSLPFHCRMVGPKPMEKRST